MILTIEIEVDLHDIDGRTEKAIELSLCRRIDRLRGHEVRNLDDLAQCVMEAKGLA